MAGHPDPNIAERFVANRGVQSLPATLDPEALRAVARLLLANAIRGGDRRG